MAATRRPTPPSSQRRVWTGSNRHRPLPCRPCRGASTGTRARTLAAEWAGNCWLHVLQVQGGVAGPDHCGHLGAPQAERGAVRGDARSCCRRRAREHLTRMLPVQHVHLTNTNHGYAAHQQRLTHADIASCLPCDSCAGPGHLCDGLQHWTGGARPGCRLPRVCRREAMCLFARRLHAVCTQSPHNLAPTCASAHVHGLLEPSSV
jgi:hypothetical protein